jgi:hypothetical protein
MTCHIEISANLINDIKLNKNKIEINKRYSFNDFEKNFTPELKEKSFKRVDTKEVLGNFHSIYKSSCNIHAKLNGGIIHFIYKLKNYSRETTIYGDTIDLDEKLFEEY